MYFQTRLLPDGLDLTQLCRLQPDHYPYALISTTSVNAINSRYDIFFAYPQESLQLDHTYSLSGSAKIDLDNDVGFLDTFDSWWKSQSLAEIKSELPFTGGWFVFLSYELVSEIEPCLNLPAAQRNVPVALAVRCPAAIIVDRVEGKTIAVAEVEYASLLDRIEEDCNQLEPGAVDTGVKSITTTRITEAETQPYIEQVQRIKQYIYDGDIFQANLSRLWELEIDKTTDDVDLFKQLALSNPGSFAAMVKMDNATVISSSPERLARSKSNRVETRPIAGTRPRSTSEATDESLAKELMAHPKEQAEHIMLIDLERNDLGRICMPGSMSVNELMVLESYQHVHHIVSNVQGDIREDVTPVDVIKAVFPGGTITGCPKVHCMEILAEMEQEARGAYTGSVGYINRDGSLDLNILIRTMVRANGQITLRAGGGIVADSDPQRELEETRAKAKGLLRIFELEKEPCSA